MKPLQTRSKEINDLCDIQEVCPKDSDEEVHT